MNDLIERIFQGFTVNGKAIPVKFLRYLGHGEPYVTYMHTDYEASYSGDDELLGYVNYYDFDFYSKGDYTAIIESVKQTLKDNGFTWNPSRGSSDMYEDTTGYFHRTESFSIFIQEG